MLQSFILNNNKKSHLRRFVASGVYGGGGNRTRQPTSLNVLSHNDLLKCPKCLAAYWLQTEDTDSPTLTPIDATLLQIAHAWPHLQPHIREVILTLIDVALPDQRRLEGGRS